MLGLALLAVCWQRTAPVHRRPALALLAYGLGFLLMMTLGAKKLDRYVRRSPALGVLAALGLAAAYGWLRDRMTAATGGAPATMVPWKGTAMPWSSCWQSGRPTTYPYSSYYNPLLGGGPAAHAR